MIRVFLLDDHEVVRRGPADRLQTAGDAEVIGESGLAREAARPTPELRPDVAILDARLPDGNGIDVCRDVSSVLAKPGLEPRTQAAVMATRLLGPRPGGPNV